MKNYTKKNTRKTKGKREEKGKKRALQYMVFT